MKILLKIIEDNKLGKLIFDLPQSSLTTIGIGGIAKYVYIPNSIDDLRVVFKYLNQNQISFRLIGNGSNILISNEIYYGLVIVLNQMPFSYEINDNILT